jgi:carbonic anhydrase
MATFTTPQLRDIVKDGHKGDAQVAKIVDDIEFLEFANEVDSVKSDVEYIQSHPLVLKETTVTGWVYDVKTGKVSLSSRL